MATETTVNELKINKLTSAQYATITPSATELYFITDDSGITSSDVTTALGYTPVNPTNLATVATSGSYNDLSNKPTIPAAVTESTVSGWGFTKNTGTVTSVNNVLPVNGNVSITIPTVPTIATSVNASSTNAETVGAKLFYDTVGNIESVLNTINSGV